MAKCCMCDANIEREDAPILSMGGGGNPRVLCDRCVELLDTATLGRDFDAIKGAIEEIGSIMAENDPDSLTFSIVSSLMVDASKRAKEIKNGTYDFALDEQNDEEGGFDEIPEELRETEEDIQKDKEDEEKLKKFDKFYNYVLIGACIGMGIFLIWKIIDTFFL